MDAACAYFSKEVARLHIGAQLENQRNHRKRRISAFGRDSGCGRGQGGYSSRAQGGGCHQGYGRLGYQVKQTEINGINIADLTRSFTYDEYTRLGTNGGRAYVTQQRLHINGQGRGADGRGGGCGGNNLNISVANVDHNTTQSTGTEKIHGQNQDTGRRGDLGGHNGGRFGCGAYQHY